MEEVNSETFTIGDKAPLWVKDEFVSMCMLCASRFGLIHRKHHCRGCGRVSTSLNSFVFIFVLILLAEFAVFSLMTNIIYDDIQIVLISSFDSRFVVFLECRPLNKLFYNNRSCVENVRVTMQC